MAGVGAVGVDHEFVQGGYGGGRGVGALMLFSELMGFYHCGVSLTAGNTCILSDSVVIQKNPDLLGVGLDYSLR